MTQKERVLQYMHEFGSITRLEAIRDLGCVQLPARIMEIKRDGVAIQTKRETSKNRYGENVSYARYTLG